MKCPYCGTENRDERDACYHCQKDLSMLRLIVNKAKHHYNLALENAERGRHIEASVELRNALDLDQRNAEAHILLGTILARQERLDEARDEWECALALNPTLEKAHSYLAKIETYRRSLPALRFYRAMGLFCLFCLAALSVWTAFSMRGGNAPAAFDEAFRLYMNDEWRVSAEKLDLLLERPGPSEETKALALSLKRLIEGRIEEARREFNDARQRQDYKRALEIIRDILARKLDPVQEERFSRLRDEMIALAKNDFQNWLETAKAGGPAPGPIMLQLTRLEEANEVYPIGLDFAELRRQMPAFRRGVEAAEVSRIKASWLESGNDKAALLRLFALTQTPASDEGRTPMSPETQELFDQLAGRERERIEEGLSRLIAENRDEEATAFLQDALKDFSEPQAQAIMETVDDVETRIAQREAEVFRRRIDQLHAGQDWEAFVALGREAGEYPSLDAAFVEDLQTTMTQARRQLAGDLFNRVRRNMDPAFDNPPGKTVDRDVAGRLIEEWDFIRDGIDEDREGYLFRQALFYRAVASFVTDRIDEARNLFQEFLDRYSEAGNADYLNSARRYLELATDRLAGEMETEAPASEEPAVAPSG